MTNHALRVADPDVTKRILNDEPVDPELIYCRCTPSFETSAERFAWIENRIFVGTVVRRPDCVEMRFFEVQ